MVSYRSLYAVVNRATKWVLVVASLAWLLSGCAAEVPPSAAEIPPSTDAAPAADMDNEVLSQQLPDAETLRRISEIFAENVQPIVDNSGKVEVPAELLEVEGAYNYEALLQILEEKFPNLLNGSELFDESTAEESFNLVSPTTFAIVGSGTIFQIVSLQAALAADEWLSDPDSLQSPLVIGLWVTYQPFFISGTEITPDLYAVLLLKEDDVLRFRLVSSRGEILGEGIENWMWQVRILENPVEIPYTFMSEREACFSQREYQACLQFDQSDLRRANSGFNKDAQSVLTDNGILPITAQTNLNRGVADLLGTSVIEGCVTLLNNNLGQECQPNALVAAVSTFAESDNNTDPNVASNEELDSVSYGIGILSVYSDIQGLIVSSSGEITTLPEGSYRLDVLVLEGGYYSARVNGVEVIGQIGQLISQDGERFYVPLLEAEIEGDTESQEEELRIDEVILGSFGFYACVTDQNRQPVCTNQKKHKVYWLKLF
jgi:hypothetical protein